MHLTLDLLRRFTPLPEAPAAARARLDAVGLEVKRLDASKPGVAVTLELLANRGDHHALVGLARELHAATGLGLMVPEGVPLEVGATPHPIHLEDARCPTYTLTPLFRDPAAPAGQLSADARALLAATGLAEVHPVVDATNVAAKELGQPTHAFDADRVVGPVRVRASRAGERAWLLFTPEPVALPEGLLVIADDEKVLAVAGVIGCEESKTTEATTRVLLESAAFDPVAVRLASRALGVHTDASARFERGSDFAAPLAGAGRVAALLAAAGWEVAGPTGVAGRWDDPRRTITWSPDACRRFLAVDADDATLFAILQRQGFVVLPNLDLDVATGAPRDPDALSVGVPTWRLWDVSHPADLYEEVAKALGYDETPVALPPIDLGAVPTPEEAARDRLADVLVGAGFYEVITDGFHGRALDEALGLPPDHPLLSHVETANALDRAYSLLKRTALPQAVEGVALNARFKHEQVLAFEFTRVFVPDAAAANGVCCEERVLWAIASGSAWPRTWTGAGRPADAAFMKGLAGELGHALGLPLRFTPLSDAAPLAALLHPGRRLEIRWGDVVVGALGEVHPGVVEAFKLKKARPVYLELSLDPLVAAFSSPPRGEPFSEPPAVPPVTRDLAFVVPRGVPVAEVVAAVRDGAPAWLLGVDVSDAWSPEGAPHTVWTLTLRLDVAAEARTTDALNAVAEAAVARVAARLGDRGVSLR
jgi:phenylalanyl-tRNA synthetase beta chain